MFQNGMLNSLCEERKPVTWGCCIKIISCETEPHNTFAKPLPRNPISETTRKYIHAKLEEFNRRAYPIFYELHQCTRKNNTYARKE